MTHGGHDVRPALHRDALKDGEHGVADVVETRHAIVGSLPVSLADEALRADKGSAGRGL